MAEVDRKARKFWQGLVAISKEFPTVFEEARGAGFLVGLKCIVPNTEVQNAFTAEGLLSVGAGENAIRLIPPLVVTDADLDEALGMIRRGAKRCLPTASSMAAK